MTKKFNQYLGKAGHLAIMSEFLMLGWNVAIPEVDIGDDIFVVQDDNGTLRRVQVKTSTSTSRKDSFSGQFNVSVKNLQNISNIPVHYVFIVRHNDEWSKPVIIRQDYLLNHFENENVGSESKGNITFYFSFSKGKAECSGQDFTRYIKDYTDFPKIEH
ncbi:hypothetical protein [Dyadobacter pollutisoli]|uniref:PD(D/E)XK endonuclease domain-containing protein n=1 Tax=Dyadobacter pollutisoli TaxID=2910158 RepID=A0A9E8NDK4_9BACT|nr:hypothetical protein [Dyadobacter pollutisoli]WAC14770.1 hypothetical protein ON006_12565 [Dyadobacter pollutisoli]